MVLPIFQSCTPRVGVNSILGGFDKCLLGIIRAIINAEFRISVESKIIGQIDIPWQTFSVPAFQGRCPRATGDWDPVGFTVLEHP